MNEKDARPIIPLIDSGSSQIAAYGFDFSTRTLEIKFRNGGRRYQYANVEPETYQAFRKATSFGTFFHQQIRGHYDYVRLADPPAEKAEDPEGTQ